LTGQGSRRTRMADRYSAFSFVDRITPLQPGTRARGHFQVPAAAAGFPPSLVAEAIGQLAAWVSMDRLDYRLRPVAGIASEALFQREVQPGQTLDLEVEIESCSETDVAYGGRALVDGEVAVQLMHCLGPMLPMEEFDHPDDVRARFELLCGPGAPAGRFSGVPDFEVLPLEHDPGEQFKALLRVPESAPFFGDHFPRRPVLPATLLLNTQLATALKLGGESHHWEQVAVLAARRMLDVKMRAFISPGQELEIRIALAPPKQGVATARLTTYLDGRRVSHARAEIASREEMAG